MGEEEREEQKDDERQPKNEKEQIRIKELSFVF